MDDYVIAFGLEILEAAINGSDGRKPLQRFRGGEVTQLADKLLTMNQDCETLVPEEWRDYFSYIAMVHAGIADQPEDGFMEVMVQAKHDVLPVLLDAGNGYVPSEDFLLEYVFGYEKYGSFPGNESVLPGYGPVHTLFPVKTGYKPWFGVFSDIIGVWLLFWYPEHPEGIIEIPYEGVDLGGFRIFWKHGVPGLAKSILQVVYLEWMVRAACIPLESFLEPEHYP